MTYIHVPIPGNVFCANRLRVPAVTLLFDALSFPYMVRTQAFKAKNNVTETIPRNIPQLKKEYDAKNAPGAPVRPVTDHALEDNGSDKVPDKANIVKSYVNIKKFCEPWPKCVLTL